MLANPTFDADLLATELTVGALHPLELDGPGLVDLRAVTTAERDGGDGAEPVLDWRFLGLMA